MDKRQNKPEPMETDEEDFQPVVGREKKQHAPANNKRRGGNRDSGSNKDRNENNNNRNKNRGGNKEGQKGGRKQKESNQMVTDSSAMEEESKDPKPSAPVATSQHVVKKQ